MRKDPLEIGEIYHVVSRSIAGFQIFNNDSEYGRMLMLMQFFQFENPPGKFSIFLNSEEVQDLGFQKYFNSFKNDQEKLVEIIAYCLMPTHIHLVLKQLKKDGISLYLKNILNSYTRYFNTKHNRLGPLWESRFKSALIKNDNQLLHLTRYIHLNPVTAYLVEKPEEWLFSSYLEYIEKDDKSAITSYDNLIDIDQTRYKNFVEDQVSYQRYLAKIKKLMLD